MGNNSKIRIDKGLLSQDHPYGEPASSGDIESFLSGATGSKRHKCVLKTVDSSGSKGVRVVEGKDWQDLLEKIHRVGNRMVDEVRLLSSNRRNPGVLVLQPFYNSTIFIKGKKYRVKIDTFLQKRKGRWQTIGSGAQIKPPDHKIVHGGPETKILVVPDSWES